MDSDIDKSVTALRNHEIISKELLDHDEIPKELIQAEENAPVMTTKLVYPI